MLRHQLSMLTQAELCPVQLWCSPDSEHLFFNHCAEEFTLTLETQVGADLGQRMGYAFQKTLTTHNPVIIVGADCPSITHNDVALAFDALLSGKPVVIQPAEDGGYVLLGLQEFTPGLFNDINWGSSSVFRQTVQILVENKLDYEVLPLRWDVDSMEDVIRLNRQRSKLGINGRLATLLINLERILITSAPL